MKSYSESLKGFVAEPTKNQTDLLNLPHPPAAIVRGTRSQDSRIYEGYGRNKQCTCMSLSAICMSKLITFPSWSPIIVDGTLDCGNRLYYLSVETYQQRFGRCLDASGFFPADETHPVVEILGHTFNISVPLEPFQGILPELFPELTRFFDQYEHGILTCSLLSVAVFKKDGTFLIFDPHKRDRNGLRLASDDAVATLASFESLEAMVATLRYNFSSNNLSLFCIAPVLVTETSNSGNMSTADNAPQHHEDTQIEFDPMISSSLSVDVFECSNGAFPEKEIGNSLTKSQVSKISKLSKRERENLRKKKDADNKRKRRENNAPSKKQSETQKKQKQRANPNFREKENSLLRKKRSIPSVRQSEREKEAQAKRQKRQDEEFRTHEREENTEFRKRKRQSIVTEEKDREASLRSKKKARQNENSRERERNNNAQRMNERRQNQFLKFREEYRTALHDGGTRADALKLKVINFRSDFPNSICMFCEGLFFPHSIRTLDWEELEEKLGLRSFCAISRSVSSVVTDKVCITCQQYVKKGKIPKLAVINGLKFPDIPACLANLKPLEERMVAPYINFMQIRPLKPRSVNPQLGLKGSVVNIPVEVNDMVNVLPRQFDNMATVQIKLKRHLDHASHYMYETIRPSKVADALNYLKSTPLYVKHGISIDENFLNAHCLNVDEEVDFIVDPSDRVNSDDQNLTRPASEVPPEQGVPVEETEKTVKERNCPAATPSDPSNMVPVNEVCDAGNENSLGDDPVEPEELIEEVDEEVLLMNRDAELNDRIRIMAPGQGKAPVPWHLQPDLEELSFPSLFCGQPYTPIGKIYYSERVKSELRRCDRRSCTPTRILYMAKKKMELACLSNINICLRKTRRTENLNAGHILDKACLDSLIKHDEGFRVLKNIRSSPAWLEDKKKGLMAMLRQLGQPTLFLTLSAAENRWPELIQGLVQINEGKKISLKEAVELSFNKKTALIKSDPTTCARYFDYKVSKIMWYLRQADGLFGSEYRVEDSYERVEFQQRGSPHEHIFLWLKNAPLYNPEDQTSVRKVVDFINTFITCAHEEHCPYTAYVTHQHTRTCYKGRRYVKKCRFHFPLPPMKATTILRPLEKNERSEQSKEDWKKVCDLCEDFFSKPRLVTFDEILKELGMTEDRYILAIRSSLKRPQVFLRRTSREVAINAHNKTLLYLFEANIDMQFILEEYGLASYIINYISKADAGLSKLLQEAADDIKNGYTNVREKLRNISNVFINANLMSAQEAVYQSYPLPIIKSSRSIVFVNTSPIAERTRMLKMNAQLRNLDADSGDIYAENIHEKYSKRPEKLNDVCLADFATSYTRQNRKDDEDENDDADEEYIYKERGKRKVLRYRRYKELIDPPNFYREQICLFYPWRNEVDEVEKCDLELKYRECIDIIKKNRGNFSAIDEDEVLEDALEAAINENREREIEEEDEFAADQLPLDQNVDVLAQGGKSSDTVVEQNRITAPQRVQTEELHSMFRRLNVKQREICMHVLHCAKIDRGLQHIFVSGAGGVGKSTVIKTIFQSVTRHYDNNLNFAPDSVKVLLCSYAGKAAYIIGGVTVHTAFVLPVTKYGGQMPPLNPASASHLITELRDCQWIIIDEVSMLGGKMATYIEQRCREIKRNTDPFGGINIIVVGDFGQIPPVQDSMIFKPPNITELSLLLESNFNWRDFKMFELTEIMRQKGEKAFIEALNNLCWGTLTEEDMKLFKSRQVKNESDVPKEAIRLYCFNKQVDAFNAAKIFECPEAESVSEAKNTVLGKATQSRIDYAVRSLMNKKLDDLKGLPHRVVFKVGIKYMITINVSVRDGLVNGAVGTLVSITYKPDQDTIIDRIWLDFGENSNVGSNARLAVRDYMKAMKLHPRLVPLSRKSVVISGSKDCRLRIVRVQFPVVPAEAMTCHKSQGQTYESVCIDFSKPGKWTRPVTYVAFSRVTSLSGLYILGEFKPPPPPKPNDPIVLEMERLRKDPLQLAFWNLENKSGLVIAYHNVRSFNKHSCDVKSDMWYSRADILILAETWTLPTDEIHFPGFRIAYRSDCDKIRAPRGLLCFVKNGVDVSQVDGRKETGEKFVMEAIRFKVGDTWVLTGYKSPGTPVSVFKSIIEVLIPQKSRVTLLGDFNFDIIGHREKCLLPFLKTHGMTSALLPETVTTDFNTQIDLDVGCRQPLSYAESRNLSSVIVFSDDAKGLMILRIVTRIVWQHEVVTITKWDNV
ncbi:unnamed protein product [Bemisia tabaci]|uniref:ATP-dependent DNA helicase n=1 Tax=Bemisia tabaci TaxID=7038 RepID=A0A9P0A4S3_BEMTA|nr:unnamed protein product [Bemisia tabaci]